MNGVFLPSAGPSIKSPSTTQVQMQIQVPTLPTLPDPESFWSSPGLSTLYLLQEAKANITAISALRSHIQSGQSNYSLPPPSKQALVPLPSIPIPTILTHHQPIHKQRIKRPIEKPEIPSYLSQPPKGKGKGKGKGVGESMVGEYIQLFIQKYGSEWEIQERYGGKAIMACNGEEGLTIWITLRTGGNELSGVKVFIGNGRSSNSRRGGGIPDLTRSDWNRGLSGLLSKLDLSLGELLYRIPHLPQLLRSTCFYCNKYLKVPDGMPLHTGYLPSRLDGRRRHSTTQVQVDGQGKNIEKREDDDNDNDGEKGEKDKEEAEEEVEEEGRWVCWHGSCGE